MAITYLEEASPAALRAATKGLRMVFEKFGPPGSGKTTAAHAMAETLSKQGKRVVVVDGLRRDGEGGVRVFAA